MIDAKTVKLREQLKKEKEEEAKESGSGAGKDEAAAVKKFNPLQRFAKR